MATVIGTLDLSRTDRRAQQIIAAFPDCFLDTEIRGVIPLSCIRGLAVQASPNHWTAGESASAADYPESYGIHEILDLPIMQFYTHEQSEFKDHGPALPAGIDPLAKQGGVVSIEGVEHVVFENNQNKGMHLMTLVLREHVDPTR